MGGDRHSHRIEADAALILQAYEAQPPIYLREVKDVLGENGTTASLSGLSRFFRHLWDVIQPMPAETTISPVRPRSR